MDCIFDGTKIKLHTRAVQMMFVSPADFISLDSAPSEKEQKVREKVTALVKELRNEEAMDPHVKSILRDKVYHECRSRGSACFSWPNNQACHIPQIY